MANAKHNGTILSPELLSYVADDAATTDRYVGTTADMLLLVERNLRKAKKRWYAKGDEACGHVLLDIAVMILAHEQQTQYAKIQNTDKKTKTS